MKDDSVILNYCLKSSENEQITRNVFSLDHFIFDSLTKHLSEPNSSILYHQYLSFVLDVVLVHKIDLSYAIAPWSSSLEDGRLFSNKFGDRVGYSYYRDEDFGIFWSNNPSKTISSMVLEVDVSEFESYL